MAEIYSSLVFFIWEVCINNLSYNQNGDEEHFRSGPRMLNRKSLLVQDVLL